MKKTFRLYAFWAFLVIALYADASVFTSVKDGDFKDPSTWGLSEFKANDDDEYVINHTVYLNNGDIKVGKITINPKGKLTKKDDVWSTNLIVSRSLENNGYYGYTASGIININEYGYLSLEVKDGSIINNGTIRNGHTELYGKVNISGTKPFECRTINISEGGEATALSDIEFLNTEISANGNSPLNMGNHKLTFTCSLLGIPYHWDVGGARDLNIHFDGVGYLNINNCIMHNCKYTAKKLFVNSTSYAYFRESNKIEADVDFASGNIFVTDTAWPEGAHLRIYGNVENHTNLNAGLIVYPKANEDGTDMVCGTRTGEISVHGNFDNYGNMGVPADKRGEYGGGSENILNLMTLGDTISISGKFYTKVTLRQLPSWYEGPHEDEEIKGAVCVDYDLSVLDNSLTLCTEMLVKENATVYVTNDYSPITVRNTDGWSTYKGKVTNYGHISILTPMGYMGSTWDSYLTVHISIPHIENFDSEKDYLLFEEFGSANPDLPTASSRWWRVTPICDNPEQVTGAIKLYYDENWLNGQDEENLRLYNSKDGGNTWDILSMGENFEFDKENNVFTLYPKWNTDDKYRIHGYGEFALSTGDGSIPTASDVKVEIVTSKQFRVGAPNRFTVHVHNITDKVTDAHQLNINCTDSLRIAGIEFPLEDGTFYSVPLDSLRDPINDPLDDISDRCQMFFIPRLEPYEDFWFDVICYGVRDEDVHNRDIASIKKFFGELWDDFEADFGDPKFYEAMVNDTGNTQKLDWVNNMYSGLRTGKFATASFVTSIKKDMAEAIIIEAANSCLDLSKEKRENWKKAFGTDLEQERRKRRQDAITGFVDGQFSTKARVKSFCEKVLDFVPGGSVIKTAGKIAEVTWSLKEGLRRQLWYWIYDQVGLFGVRTKDGDYIEGSRIYSWDPNEMVGPAGLGPKNAIAEGGRMNYRIKFENKKEATAPAYRIRIKDVLDTNVFDPETVEFGHTSHGGSKYNWKMNREGNVLTWDIEGIELMPNVNAPEGEGFVTFSVKTKDNLPSGTLISNKADIIFDENPVISTNTYTNVLDKEAPTSHIDFWNYTSAEPTMMKVAAYSEDADAGVRSVDVYLSEDGTMFKKVMTTNGDGPFEIEVSDIKSTCRLYTIATDWVGNIQSSYEIINVNDYSNGIENISNTQTPNNTKEDNLLYDTSGRKVTTPTKGVYILNGKKVIFN